MLELLPTHFTEQQIAEQLFVSHNTVKTHLKCVYRKLGVSSRAEAVQRAHEAGLLLERLTPAQPVSAGMTVRRRRRVRAGRAAGSYSRPNLPPSCRIGRACPARRPV